MLRGDVAGTALLVAWTVLSRLLNQLTTQQRTEVCTKPVHGRRRPLRIPRPRTGTEGRQRVRLLRGGRPAYREAYESLERHRWARPYTPRTAAALAAVLAPTSLP